MSRLISPIELRDSVVSGQQLQLIDVRSASEYGSGHVPGAVNIPMEQLEVRLADLTQRGEIVLICQGGKRASTCANWIHDRRDVAVLEGGTTAWSKAGFPLTECTACRWSLERQIRFGAGVMVLVGALLALTISTNWLYLPLFIGSGLTFAGLTDICPMGMLLARMPWNRGSVRRSPIRGGNAGCCS